jgi:hypothetical protein
MAQSGKGKGGNIRLLAYQDLLKEQCEVYEKEMTSYGPKL